MIIVVSVSSRIYPTSCDKPVCDTWDDDVGALNVCACEPKDRPVFNTIEFVVFIVLMADYCLRMASVGFVPPRLL
jgi:hypothetical protein